MTATQRIRAMLTGQPVKEIGASGWLHTPGPDRGTAEEFSSEIIRMTDYSRWDVIKIMPNGVYNQEAHGSDIEYFSGKLSQEDLKAKRVFQFRKYLVNSPRDMEAFPVLDVSKNPVYQREVANVRALAAYYQGTVPILPTIFTPAHCIPEFVGGIDKARWYIDNHPDAVDAMLRALVQTELQLVDAYIDAGADGFFFAQRYSNSDILSEKEFERFARPYDEMLLSRIKNRTWFNMIHVHGARNFFWDQFKTYDVQALSWENTPLQIPEEERSTVAKVRSISDKILVTGTDQFHDFYGTPQEVLDRFRQRVAQAAQESEDNRLIFAPGCSLPLDIPEETVHLLRVAADEYNAGLRAASSSPSDV